MSTWGLLGHDSDARAFCGSHQAGRLVHSYLITGTPAIGRRTFAIRMAQQLRCQCDGPPCLACSSCQAVAPDAPFWRTAVRRDHPHEIPDAAPRRDRVEERYVLTSYFDVAVLRKRDGHRDIPIRGVRELVAESHLKPAQGRARVSVIDAAEELSVPAANALLKTLEEPASHAVLILIAQRVGDVLPTIVSRCRHISLTPVAACLIAAHLVREHDADPDVASLIAVASRGRPGWAIRMVSDPSRWQAYTERCAAAEEFERSSPSDRFLAVEDLVGRGRAVQQSKQASSWLEKISCVQAGELRAAMRDQTVPWSPEATGTLSAVVARMMQVRSAQLDLQRNVTPRVVLEDLAMRPTGDVDAT